MERVDFSKIVLKDSRGHITKSIKDIDVNITSFRLVDPDTPNAREYLKDWTPVPDTTGVFGRGRAHPLFVSNKKYTIRIKKKFNLTDLIFAKFLKTKC